MNAEEMKLLQAQNEALKKQCNSLQQEVKQWKYEYEILDACIELEQGKIAELKAENDKLKRQLEFDSRYNDMQAELDYGEKLIEKYKSCLQEIRAIAEENKDTAQYGGICKSILMIITKAEEE